MQRPEAQQSPGLRVGGWAGDGSPASLVLGLLRERRGPITLAVLAQWAHLPRRDTEAAVEELRLQGEPIVGGSEGIRLTSDPAELAAYLEQRRRRTARIHRGTMRLRSTLRLMRERTDLVLRRDVA